MSWVAFILEYVLPVLTGSAAAPIIKRFLASWRERRNAMSLAIAGAVLACAIVSLTPFVVARYRIGAMQLAVGLTLLNAGLLVAGFAYARRHERMRFQDQRGRMGTAMTPPKDTPP